jgi:cytochrome oxidase Cu insertion factor (SCO1/SenC/PrrC family)
VLGRLRSTLAGAVLALACIGAAQARASLYTIEEPWLADDGQRVQLTQWRGRPTVVAMEYSACRFICSVYWRRLVQVQAEADRLGLDVQFVILSIDPEHDTPADWRAYRKARDLARGNWHFLTGTRAMTTRAAALLGVRWWYDEDHLMHDFRIVRLDDAGGVAAALTRYDEPVAAILARP